MRPNRAGAAIAVLMLAAGARAYADPASVPAPAASAQLTSAPPSSAQLVSVQTSSTQSAGIAAEARAAKGMAAQAIATLETTSAAVRALLRRARALGTRDEIACVDEGLSRTDVAMRRAREEAAAAQDAYAQGNVDEARRANARVIRARDAAKIAASAAGACIPPPARTTGTQVRIVRDATPGSTT